jgi:acetolactate synthase I/II/III large subunit
MVDTAARILRSGEPTVLLLGGASLRAEGLALAGRVPIERVPYFVDLALAVFKEVRHVILVGACAPVAFFGYPGKPSALTPSGCDIRTLAAPTRT